MSTKLQELQAKFKALKAKKEEKFEGGKGLFHPHWNMPEGSEFRIRLIKDTNPDNAYDFHLPKYEHTLSIGGKDQKIPCLHNYGEECPICELSKKFYKEAGKGNKSPEGLYYYRKLRHVAYAYVISDPVPPEKDAAGKDLPNKEGQCVALQLEKLLVEKITNEVLGSDMPCIPWELEEAGLDFLILKTKKGEFSDTVSLSKFVRTPTVLTAEQRANITPIDLSTLIPKNPGYDKVSAMLTAHLNGQDFSDDKDNSETNNKTETKTETVAESTVETKPAVTETKKPLEPKKPAADDSAEDQEIANFLARKKK